MRDIDAACGWALMRSQKSDAPLGNPAKDLVRKAKPTKLLQRCGPLRKRLERLDLTPNYEEKD